MFKDLDRDIFVDNVNVHVLPLERNLCSCCKEICQRSENAVRV